MNLPYRPNVGILLRNASGAFFMGDRKNISDPNWQFPQGGLDEPGVIDGAVREIWEETGIPSHLVAPIEICPVPYRYDIDPAFPSNPRYAGIYRGQEQVWSLFDFLGTDADVNIHTEEPEFKKWAWVPRAEIMARIAPFKVESATHALRYLIDKDPMPAEFEPFKMFSGEDSFYITGNFVNAD